LPEATPNRRADVLHGYGGAAASWKPNNFPSFIKAEGFDEGYQSVPVNWGISSERKRQFFKLLAEITGSQSQ